MKNFTAESATSIFLAASAPRSSFLSDHATERVISIAARADRRFISF